MIKNQGWKNPDVSSRVRVDTAVLLCGHLHMHEWLPLNGHGQALLPVLGLPLVCHAAEALVKAGVQQIVCVSDTADTAEKLREFLPNPITFTYSHEKRFQGTAGSLRVLAELGQLERFFVIRGNVFVQDNDLAALARNHAAAGSVATVAADDSGRPSGIYLFEAGALGFINGRYTDLDAHLIPHLEHLRAVTWCVFDKGGPIRIDSVEKLMSAEHGFLKSTLAARARTTTPAGVGSRRIPNSLRQMADEIWTGRNVRIAPGAKLTGPVLIGDGTVIGDKALIMGPAVIGHGCRIGKGAIVRESTIWDGAEIAAGAVIHRSLIGFNARVSARQAIGSAVVPAPPIAHGLVNVLNELTCGGPLKAVLSKSVRLRKYVYDSVKRCVDIAGAVAGLVLGAPLFLTLAMAIKLDSPGPIFFRQRRCGKGGKEFPMLKFRTMHADADRMEPQLSHLNCMDGPVFKLRNDPRVTRIGNFLRRTSLDELPQLINVLRGEMSLVGPRPLVARQMEGCLLWRRLRLSVKPGITGLWQVKGRYSDSFLDWLEYDTAYVKHQSLRQDFAILWQTFAVVLPAFFGK